MLTATCPLCEASCGILVDTDGERVRSIRGDQDDPLSRGYVCPKASALVDLHDDPDRVRAPLIREGSRWREVSWDDALDRASEGLVRVRQEHGRDAVAMYYGNPVAHNLGLMTHALPFAHALRTRNVYSASSADQLPQMLAALRMFGHLALIPVPDLERTDYFLIVGANPVVSNGSLMTAPNMKGRLRAIRDRGGRVVVVDPRRTETAEVADEHVAIRPGTDALFLAAMLHVVFAEGWVRLGRLDGRVKNVDALAAFVRELPPERVARRTGVPPEITRRLAGDFARVTRAACYGRVGLCTQRHGTLAVWLTQALNLVTGHLDEVGGMMLTTPAVDVVAMLSRFGMRGPSIDGAAAPVIAGVRRRLPGGRAGDKTSWLTGAVPSSRSPGIVPRTQRWRGLTAPPAHRARGVDRCLPERDDASRARHTPPAPPLSRAHYDLALYASRSATWRNTGTGHPAEPERHDWNPDRAGRPDVIPRPLRRVAPLPPTLRQNGS